LASEEGDVESFTLLEWFLNEQVEEEATVEKILGQLGHVGDDGSALLLLDRELAARTLSAPPGG
jgi:ferritin